MGTRKEQLRRRLLATFQVEAEDYIKGILVGLSTIERALDEGPLSDSTLIEPVFRQFHSLKGSSQAIGFDNVGHICQTSENILSTWKKSPTKANKAELSSILESALSAATSLNIDLTSSATDFKPITPSSASVAYTNTNQPQPILSSDVPVKTGYPPAPYPSPLTDAWSPPSASWTLSWAGFPTLPKLQKYLPDAWSR